MQRAYDEDVAVIEGFRPIPRGALIGGDWEPVTGPARDVVDPATAGVIATVQDCDPESVDRAVRSARQAFGSWSSLATAERAVILERVADAIRDHAAAIARIETIDTGKPLSQSVSDVRIAERYFRYYAHAAEHLFGDTIPSAGGLRVVTEREPYGIVAHITPWNAPIAQLARGVAPSLAVGNTVVVKPSELAPLSSIMLGHILRDVLPAGVMSLIPGDGIVTGAALASHPGIDHLTFTGSVTTGASVARAAAANIVATNLELGGKSAAIVFPGADLNAAVKSATGAVVRNSGQSCSALTRFIVHRSVVEEFSSRLVRSVEALTIGPGIDDPDLGPLVSEAQRTKVLGLIREAVDEGGTLLTGSATAPTRRDLQSGWFVSPTVVGDVTPAMIIAQTEVFGPVQTVMAFDTEDEAADIANGTDYGLAAAVFTKDVDVAARLSRRLRAGQVQINGFIGAGAEIPFGGYRHSGHGREKGFEALYGYTQVKAIVTHVADLERL